MNPRTTGRMLGVFLLLLGAMIAPGVAAQDSVAAVEDKLREESAAAEDDPTGWAAGRTDENQTGDDLRWAVRTACWARDDAEDATGERLPDPTGVCPTLQDAVAVAAGEEEEEEEDVAQADPLADDTIPRTEAYLDETADMVRRILAEPTTALTEATSAIDRTLAYLRAIATGLVDGIGHGLAAAVAAERAGLRELTLTFDEAARALRDAAVLTATAPFGLAADAGQRSVMLATAATGSMADALADAYDNVRAFFGTMDDTQMAEEVPQSPADPVPRDVADIELPALPDDVTL